MPGGYRSGFGISSLFVQTYLHAWITGKVLTHKFQGEIVQKLHGTAAFSRRRAKPEKKPGSECVNIAHLTELMAVLSEIFLIERDRAYLEADPLARLVDVSIIRQILDLR